MIRSRVHQRAQLRLYILERRPRFLHAAAEWALNERQGEYLAAALDHVLRIRIAGERGKRLLKMREGAVLAVEVVVGIAHAEVPEMIALEVVRMRREEGDRLFKIRTIIDACGIVVGTRQLAVKLRRALCGGERFELRDDLLIFFVLVPNLALFE